MKTIASLIFALMALSPGPAFADELESRLKGVLTQHFRVAPQRITPETSLVGDLRADELDLVELNMALEEEFRIEVPEEESQKFKTVGDILQFLRANPYLREQRNDTYLREVWSTIPAGRTGRASR